MGLQGIIELPYIMVQSVFFVLIVYSMVRFEWTGAKFFWFLLFETMSLVLFTFYGIVSVSLTPNLVVASIISGTTYFIFALFCGFIIQAPSIPGWWCVPFPTVHPCSPEADHSSLLGCGGACTCAQALVR